MGIMEKRMETTIMGYLGFIVLLLIGGPNRKLQPV